MHFGELVEVESEISKMQISRKILEDCLEAKLLSRSLVPAWAGGTSSRATLSRRENLHFHSHGRHFVRVNAKRRYLSLYIPAYTLLEICERIKDSERRRRRKISGTELGVIYGS
ncbi:uncharacterized protein LOC105698208 [Orussus abietinus]|uniref:uncharacterized protein LOC105698208 n=1 Tax=Orussus abietinus TaxID=222816 RepID=UPI00062536DC|nr:uncharacterized protein LOC105698208 [Orussus abietinus]